jgi:TRAP-type C4-dicarboxylate transport system permease small subunit
MKKTLGFLRTFEQTFSYVLIVLLTVLLSTQVINRYIFSTSFVWVEEIARISFVC